MCLCSLALELYDLKNQHPEYVISGIRNMKKISVREENSQRIVEQITGRSPEIVLESYLALGILRKMKML